MALFYRMASCFEAEHSLTRANTADLVNVAFVVTEHVSAVKHYDPGIFGVVLESRA